MKNGKIRTYPIKNLTIFLAVCFVVSTAMLVVFSLPFMQNEIWVIKIMVWVLCGIFSLASLVVLIYQLCFYVEVKEGYFTKYFLFGRKRIEITKIDRITNNDGFYIIYHNGKRFASFAGNTKEGQEIIVFLERMHVKIEW